MNEPELEIWDWATFKRKAQEDEEMNGEKYRYNLAIAKCWLRAGGRITLMKWVHRKDYETHLICKAGRVVLIHCTGEEQPFCNLDKLEAAEFLLIPQNHAISEFMPYANWSYRSTML